MNDPHVVALRYRLVPAPDITFEHPAPVERTLEQFDFHLADGIAVTQMREHYADVGDARQVVEPYLRAYEFQTALAEGAFRFHFEFDAPTIVDRRPSLLGEPLVIVVASDTLSFSDSCAATLHLTYHAYPDPPDTFRVSPDVESMWYRYEGWKTGREPLASMAYFCLTFVEKVVFQSRDVAVAQLGVSESVLKTIRRLANVGDKQTARKADITELRPHTAQEVHWLKEAVLTLIRRMAEYACDPAVAHRTITMADLPPLDRSEEPQKRKHR